MSVQTSEPEERFVWLRFHSMAVVALLFADPGEVEGPGRWGAELCPQGR